MSETDDKIIYLLIAKNEKPLMDYSNFSGTFNQICLKYLKKIEPNTSKAIKIDDFIVFYITDNSMIFMLMAGKSYPKEGAIGCLQSIKNEFNRAFEGRDFEGELNFGLNDHEFKEKLKLKFELFNEQKDLTDDKIYKLKEQLALMKDEIANASDLLDERGDKIKILDEKSDILSRDSNTYYRKSKRVSQYERCKKIKYYIGISLAVLIVIYFVISLICGFTFQKCRK